MGYSKEDIQLNLNNLIENIKDIKGESILKLIDNSPSCICVFDSRFTLVSANKSMAHLCGCESSEEFILNFERLSPVKQLDGKKSIEKYSESLNMGYELSEYEFEWMHCTTSGDSVPVKILFVKSEIKDSHGNYYMMAYVKDNRPHIAQQNIEEQFQNQIIAILDAAPLCLNLWNIYNENIMCNQMAAKLFELEDKQQYLDRFIDLSPLYQPNGMLSSALAMKNIGEALKNGYKRFKWLHCKLNGEEIPCEITLVKISAQDVSGNDLVAGFTRDLRGEFANDDEIDVVDDYFHNQISEKILLHTVSQLTNECFFSLDLRTSMIRYIGKGKEVFGFSDGVLVFPEHILSTGRVLKDDQKYLKDMMKNIKKGISETVDIRFLQSDGELSYCRIIYKVVFGKGNKPVYAVGKIIEITQQKLIEVKSKTDLLTSCYNKVTTESMIEDILRNNPEESYALFIVDIDDFKSVNDNLGHHFGDLVLTEVASNLKKCFRKEDVIGRIGGDEFIVFTKNIESIKILYRKAEVIVNAFKNTYSGEDKTYKISGSVGVSKYPLHGNTYEELYKCADKALYQSKLKGKDCYTFYSETLRVGTMRNLAVLENANRIASSYFDSEIVSTAFNLLYEAKDFKTSVQAFLQHWGKKYDADRSYIFETFDDGKTYHNTYEWVNTGISAEIGNLQNIPYEVLKEFFTGARGDGIIYSNDLGIFKDTDTYKLMDDQGIKSFLHAQIKSGENVTLFLGLDDCTKNRIWSEKEVNSVLYLAKIVSTFLLVEKMKKKYEL